MVTIVPIRWEGGQRKEGRNVGGIINSLINDSLTTNLFKRTLILYCTSQCMAGIIRVTSRENRDNSLKKMLRVREKRSF